MIIMTTPEQVRTIQKRVETETPVTTGTLAAVLVMLKEYADLLQHYKERYDDAR